MVSKKDTGVLILGALQGRIYYFSALNLQYEIFPLFCISCFPPHPPTRCAEVGYLLKIFSCVLFHDSYIAKFLASEHSPSNNKSSQTLACCTQDTVQNWANAFCFSPEKIMHVRGLII